MYKNSVMRVQNFCFALYAYHFFDVLIVVADVVAKAPYWFTLCTC